MQFYGSLWKGRCLESMNYIYLGKIQELEQHLLIHWIEVRIMYHPDKSIVYPIQTWEDSVDRVDDPMLFYTSTDYEMKKTIVVFSFRRRERSNLVPLKLLLNNEEEQTHVLQIIVTLSDDYVMIVRAWNEKGPETHTTKRKRLKYWDNHTQELILLTRKIEKVIRNQRMTLHRKSELNDMTTKTQEGQHHMGYK